MKKKTKIFVGVLAAVLLLSASVVYALSDTANEAAVSGKEQVKDVVSVNDESVPLTEAIEASSRASTDAYGFSVSELSPVDIQAADAQMIARDRQNDAECSVMGSHVPRRPARFTGRSRFAPCRFGHGRRCIHRRKAHHSVEYNLHRCFSEQRCFL